MNKLQQEFSFLNKSQKEFSFLNKSQRKTPVVLRIRGGQLPTIVTYHDIDKIISPHGEAAQDAFDRDASMMDDYDVGDEL